MAETKRENGIDFPAAAFAFVPDESKPDGWKLRIWESLDAKVTVAQLGRVTAAFSPGGLNGERVQLPLGETSKVKMQLRAEYRQLGIERVSALNKAKAIPFWIEETDKGKLIPMKRCNIGGPIQLIEDAFNEETGELTFRVIESGFNKSGNRYYPKETLERDHDVFNGCKMFLNHQTKQEKRDRSERDTKEDVAQITATWVEDGDVFARSCHPERG